MEWVTSVVEANDIVQRLSKAWEKYFSYWNNVKELNRLRGIKIWEALNLPIPEELKSSCRAAIQEFYGSKINEIFSGEDFKESEEKYFNTIKERDEIFKKRKLKPEIFWDRGKVIEDMEKNRYIWIEKDQEMLDKKWYVIHIALPQAWDFGWYKDDMFISYDEVPGDLDSKYEEVSYSFQDCKHIYDMLGAYLTEYWLDHVFWCEMPNSKWSYDYWVDDYFEIGSYYAGLMNVFKKFWGRIIDCWISDTEIHNGELCRYCWDFNWRDWDFITYRIHNSLKSLLLHYNGK